MTREGAAPSLTAVAGPLSHARYWRDGVVQAVSPPGTIDLGPGYLEPCLLPVDLLREAYTAALVKFGAAALSYGDNRGARPLREALAVRIGRADGRPCTASNVIITAGTSHALYLIATLLAAPGQVVLVEQTSYDLGRVLFRDCGLRIREVPADSSGMDPAALEEAVAAERAAGRKVAFGCLTPTFHNPTGVLTPPQRRSELLNVARRQEILLVEDDAYADLDLDGAAATCSMAGLVGYQGVIRLQTFSKTLAPGLRLGWLLAEPEVASRFARHGLFASGGSANHLASLAATMMLRSGEYDRHLSWLRVQLKERRDALASGLQRHLGEEISFVLPQGGFFLWLRWRGQRSEHTLTERARRSDVLVAAGTRFGTTTSPSLRLAYSFNHPDRLADAARLLAGAWKTNSRA
jgi:2-aminoadipate transaminase